jgi:Flp pilus assembly protein TadG
LVLVFVTLVLFVGVAVDGTRAFYTKDVLQKSLDAAGLAAGHTLDDTYVESDAREFFNANFNNLGGNADLDELIINVSDDNSVITLNAAAIMETTFMRLGGFDTLRVTASTEITRQTVGLELALIMDNTYSMNTQDSGAPEKRIVTMKTAAEDLINIVFGTEEVHPNLWVSLVPFVATVNVGSGRTSWLSGSGQTFVASGAYDDSVWKGCVEARYPGGNDLTDATPSTERFEPFHFPDNNASYSTCGRPGINNYFTPGDTTTPCIRWRRGRCRKWGAPVTTPASYDIKEAASDGCAAQGPSMSCGEPIQELTPTKTTIINAIRAQEPTWWGGTTNNLGLVWGWRTISPAWRGLWGGDTPADHPVDYTDSTIKKVAVMLTDGENNWLQFSGNNKTAYGFRADHFGSDSAAKSFLDGQLATVCTNMKAVGIEIFTIAFGSTVTSSSTILNLMRNCATTTSHYFAAPTAADLQVAFTIIGNQLQALRISK